MTYPLSGGAEDTASHSREKPGRGGERGGVGETPMSGRDSININYIKRGGWREGVPVWESGGGGSSGGIRVHQAAIPSVPRSVKDPITSNRANVDGTPNVLVAARDAGVRRLVFAGSSSAYGDTPTLPKDEDMPTNPLSPYALQKVVGSSILQMFTRGAWSRDRQHPLLQCLRPSPGSVVSLLGSHLGVCNRAAREPFA